MLRTRGALPLEERGFNADAIMTDTERIYWQENYLIRNLKYRFQDDAENAPKICAESPHQLSNSQGPDEFFPASKNKSTENGCRSQPHYKRRYHSV